MEDAAATENKNAGPFYWHGKLVMVEEDDKTRYKRVQNSFFWSI